MTDDNALKLARLFYAAKIRQKATRELLAPVEHQLVLHLLAIGKKTIDIGNGQKLRVVPGYPVRYTPSQRKKIRKEAFGVLLRDSQQPPRLIIDKDRRG